MPKLGINFKQIKNSQKTKEENPCKAPPKDSDLSNAPFDKNKSTENLNKGEE